MGAIESLFIYPSNASATLSPFNCVKWAHSKAKQRFTSLLSILVAVAAEEKLHVPKDLLFWGFKDQLS